VIEDCCNRQSLKKQKAEQIDSAPDMYLEMHDALFGLLLELPDNQWRQSLIFNQQDFFIRGARKCMIGMGKDN
jgi:hypothetical protein